MNRSNLNDPQTAVWGIARIDLCKYLESHTIPETLLWLMADEKNEDEIGRYYCLAHFGELGDWAGADLVSDWFRRNMRIFRNIRQLIDSPNERLAR